MRWTKAGPNHISGLYRIHAEDDKWHVDMPVNGPTFTELPAAKEWCSEHERRRSLKQHVAAAVAEAPPISPAQAADIVRLLGVEEHRGLKRAERQPHPADAPSPPGLTKRRLPGAPERSNEEVLSSARERWAQATTENPMYSLRFIPPEDMFRWRVQFDCGCVEDWCNTSDDPQSLLDATRPNPFDVLDGKKRLLPGEYLCTGAHSRPDLPLREVTSWDERICEKVILADPVKPPDWWIGATTNKASDGADCDADESWETVRQSEPKTVAEWTATLTCGHGMKTQKSLDWTPDQGVLRSPETVIAIRSRHVEVSSRTVGLLSHWLPDGRTTPSAWIATSVPSSVGQSPTSRWVG